MLRKLTVLFLCLMFCLTTVACGSSNPVSQSNSSAYADTTPMRLSAGEYPVQQASYNDANGEYSIMLLNTPPGVPPVFKSAKLQMARLTDEEIKAGKKSYVKSDGKTAVFYLSEDFKIEYTHNVVETRTNPQNGQRETVVVRQESSFWTPFAGALAGNMVANMLFTPSYYVPPVYRSGGLVGYGGQGSTYRDAVNQYQTRYQAPPPAVKNRQVLRTSGSINSPSTNRRINPNSNRSSGSGFGGSNLESSGQGKKRNNGSSGFGSGTRRSAPMRSGGRRR